MWAAASSQRSKLGRGRALRHLLRPDSHQRRHLRRLRQGGSAVQPGRWPRRVDAEPLLSLLSESAATVWDLRSSQTCRAASN